MVEISSKNSLKVDKNLKTNSFCSFGVMQSLPRFNMVTGLIFVKDLKGKHKINSLLILLKMLRIIKFMNMVLLI